MAPVQTDPDGLALVTAVPRSEPSSAALAHTVDRVRETLPDRALVGGQAAENHDLERALAAKVPLVIGVVLALAFVLLLIAFRAPLIAAIGVLANLLATGAAFGVATLIFQDGHLSGLLGFTSQGFLDAWAPVFFFAMIFAISMDYTVFLLSSAREHWEQSGDPRTAMVGAMADSGRVILAAGAVMVAVFFTFALSGPLPPKEMGVILGIAVLLDTFLVRLLLLPVFMRLAGRAAWYLPPGWTGCCRTFASGTVTVRRSARPPAPSARKAVEASVCATGCCRAAPPRRRLASGINTRHARRAARSRRFASLQIGRPHRPHPSMTTSDQRSRADDWTGEKPTA